MPLKFAQRAITAPQALRLLRRAPCIATTLMRAVPTLTLAARAEGATTAPQLRLGTSSSMAHGTNAQLVIIA